MALWAWHAPSLFQATVESDLIHSLQHLSFLLSALLFWWALLRGREAEIGYGMAVLYVFSTGVHSSILGALLTFSPRIWYPVYSGTTPAWGLTPLEDQQIGGLIMWVPAGLVFLVAGLALFGKWIQQPARAAVICLSFTLIGCTTRPAVQELYKEALKMTGGDSGRGKQAILHYGCGTCHTIPGIEDANGLVGPPLTRMAVRTYIAGVLPNTPTNMERWISDPPAVDKLTAMPKLGVAGSRSSRHRRLSLHSPLTKLELLFYVLRLLAGISEVQQSRRRNGRGDSHEYDHGINRLIDDCHTQAELRHHHSNFAARHHSAANPHHLYASESDSPKPHPISLEITAAARMTSARIRRSICP